MLLKLLGEAHTGGTVTVRIGHEGPYQELASTSVVATGYGPGDEALGNARRRRARPGWTTRARWPRCARSPATSPASSTRPDPDQHDHQRKTTREPRPLRSSSASPATPTPTRSRRPTAGWPVSCTPTSTPTRRRRSGSRRSRAPTRCSRDPEKRAVYDLGGDPFGRGGAGFGQGRLLLHRHHGRLLRRRRRAAARAAARVRATRRGQDALIRIEVELAEAAFGVTRELKVDTAVLCTTCQGEGAAPGTHPVTCETCHGTRRGRRTCSARSSARSAPCGRARPAAASARSSPTRAASAPATAGSASRRSLTVKIPAGVDTGTRVQLAGEGEVGPGGGPAGDLYVEIHVAPAPGLHPRRHRPALHGHRADDRGRARHDDPTLPTLEADVGRAPTPTSRREFEPRRAARHPVRQPSTPCAAAACPACAAGAATSSSPSSSRPRRRLDPRQEELLRELAAHPRRGEARRAARPGAAARRSSAAPRRVQPR